MRHSEETKRKISKSLTGKILSLETRQKMSLAQKGVPKPSNKISLLGNKNGVGRKDTEENIERKRKSWTGKSNPAWKGGITPDLIIARSTPEQIKWAKDVKDRDKYTCQKCGNKSGGNLNSHHLMKFSEYPELRTVLDNGITLCEECHKLTRKLGSYETFKELLDALCSL